MQCVAQRPSQEPNEVQDLRGSGKVSSRRFKVVVEWN